MSTHLINIMASSNVAEVLALDTEAAEANTVAVDKNTASLKTNAAAAKKAAAGRTKLRKKKKDDGDETETLTQKVLRLTRSMLGLDKAQHTVGYNIMGLSVRIGQWFVPAMVLMYSSILPVIAGLLAIGSAAGVAALGLVGVLGIGAAVMSHRFNKVGNYGGPRQPYGTSGESVFTMLLKPIWEALESPELESRVKFAVDFVRDLFSRLLPDSLTTFLMNVNPGAMQKIVSLFNDWLPKAAEGLAVWGSNLMNSIGPRSLKTINDFFKYLAAGVTNTAKWLNAGGWDQIDNVTTILGDVISTFLDLGKSALPVLTTALNQVWPMPLKRLMAATTAFFGELGKNEDVMDTFATIMQIVAGFGLVRFAASLLSGGLGVAAIAITGLSTTLLITEEAVFRLKWAIIASVKAIAAGILGILDSMFSWLNEKVGIGYTGSSLERVLGWGTDYASDLGNLYDDLTGKGTVAREKMDEKWDRRAGTWEAGKKAIHIFFHPDGAYIDDYAEETESGELGTNVSWEYSGAVPT